MNKEEAIKFAGLMEEYLHIPTFVCEMIEKQLEDNKYKEVVEYVIQRRNEIENKEDYISEQQTINMWINKLEEKDKEIDRLNNDIKILLNENENKEKVIKKQQEEINRLNKSIKLLTDDLANMTKKALEQENIIDKLEKWLEENKKDCNDEYYGDDILDKLKELKENK